MSNFRVFDSVTNLVLNEGALTLNATGAFIPWTVGGANTNAFVTSNGEWVIEQNGTPDHRLKINGAETGIFLTSDSKICVSNDGTFARNAKIKGMESGIPIDTNNRLILGEVGPFTQKVKIGGAETGAAKTTNAMKAVGLFKTNVLNEDSANLVRYWRLNETSGNTAADLSSNAENVAYDGPTIGAARAYDPNELAPSFDGSNDSLDIIRNLSTDYSNRNIGSMLIAFYISEADAVSGSYRHTTVFRDSVNNSSVNFMRWGGVAYEMRAQAIMQGSFKTISFDLTGKTDRWHIALLTWDTSGNFNAYLNGVAGTPSAFTQVWGAGAITHARIGRRPESASQYWSGNLAEIAIWKSELTATAAGKLYIPGRSA